MSYKAVKVRMVQVMPGSWRIESANGHIINDNIIATNVVEATNYVEKYISSFMGWSYELVLLPESKKDLK